MIDLNNVRSKDYEKNEKKGRKGGEDPCILCGKKILHPKKLVHLLTDGNICNLSEDENSQGYFPIGNDCAKKLPKDYVFDIQTLL